MTESNPSPRRSFLRQVTLGTASLAAWHAYSARALVADAAAPVPSQDPARIQPPGPLRFGIISDVHHDIMHDGIARVGAFVRSMTRDKADFIIQLGDFCWPVDRNRPFLDAWNQFPGPRHHVLGNHDMDGQAPRERTVAFLGMPHRFHAFEHGGWKWIVLDGNDPGGKAPGYRRFVAQDQLEWLSQELRRGQEPVIVFIHQALDHPQGIENQDAVRTVIQSARWHDGSPRVSAVFAGHHHQDWLQVIDGIPHVQINSASNHWVGDTFAHDSYPEHVLEAYPWIRRTCPYRDPLWAMVTLDPVQGRILIEGRTYEWVGPGPVELGIPHTQCPPESTVPMIRSRTVKDEG
jgi:Icc protein